VVVGTGDGLTVVAVGVGVVVCVLGVVACVFGVVACVPAEAFEVAVPDDEDPDDEKIAGTVDDGEPVQAETVAAMRTIKVAQPRTASRGLLAGLAEVMRTLMEPP
jgi:Na+-transporting methylmalonyl-CoA/oxaloacetate decarboxylase gamma subunit